MKAAIIGAAGFVGKYLINCLAQAEYDVVATKLEHEVLTDNNAAVYNLDILKAQEVNDFFDEFKPDAVFHLAAQSSVALSWKNPKLTAEVNVIGTVNILEALKNYQNNARILLIGSGEEYGTAVNDGQPIREDNAVHPGNIYAVTKAAQNMLGDVYSRAYGLDIIKVRAFNHMGPGQSPDFVVSDFCRQIADIENGKNGNVIYVGNLSAERDFTDVRDVVKAYLLLSQKGKKGETYNVGCGKAIPIQKILDTVLDMAKTDIEVKSDPNKLRPADIPVICADISKITSDIGWMPEIPVEKTVEDTLNYWRNLK